LYWEGPYQSKTFPPTMDENVQRSNESIKQRNLVHSIEQISPIRDVYSILPESNVHSTGQSQTLHTQPSASSSPTHISNTSPSAATSLSTLLSPTKISQDVNLQSTSKNGAHQETFSNSLATATPAGFSLILPQNLNRSFDQTAAQSPPKYQIYHQFSRISSTTQQFIQRQQQQQLQQQEQHQQIFHPQAQPLQLQQSPQTQPASPVTNYQTPLFRKASYGSSHYAHYSNVDPLTVNAGTLSARPNNTYHQYQTTHQCSKTVDQRSNNPFILNFNNISGCCLKNSPTSSSSPPATSPTDRSITSAPITGNPQSVTSGSSSSAITAVVSSGTKRTRSLLLKSTSPLQQTTHSSPSHTVSSPQGPPVPPRLSHIHAICSISPANTGPTFSNHPSIDPISTTTSSNASSEAIVMSSIVTGTCYVTPPTPAPLITSDKHRELPSMTFGSVTPTVVSNTLPDSTTLTASGHNKTPTDGNESGLLTKEMIDKSVRKKRDDFLRTTMKICLVVSPPSKLQAALGYSTKLGGTSSTSSLKKKSSSFLHRERKKPVLTRSQVSSSEYFSVCFESDQNDPGVLIPATKGVRLAECLRASLSRRSLSFSQIYVTDNGFNNPHETGLRYTEPLDANMDISALAGRTLIVSERDGAPNRRTGGHLTLQKAASVGNQPSIMSSNSKLFTSTSTDDNYDQSPKASSASGKQSKQKWTIPFGSKGPQKSKLCELLDSYNKEIPKSTSSSSNFNNPEYVDALVGLRNLPQCWTDIVNCAGMSEAETKIQSAIWELVTTEVYYILALQTVTDLFLACLEDIQSQNILTDVDQNKLFSNIRDIWEANLRFWTLYLHPMVKHSQRTKDPMSIYYFQRGFVDFATIFTPYTKYCAEQSTCQFYCKEMYHNNALFMTYCAWCESQKMCNRLRLADILVRPMQRLTKYGLLLAAIKKHINDEAEGEAIDAMIHSVEEFVAGVNSHLTTRQESERLKGINARIDCYEVVDSNNETLDRLVKQHSIMFDLCQPMRGIDHGRKVFVEGDLKYKDGTGKMDVHCFLFTDFLLVCKKNKNDKLKIVRQPYMTDRLMVQLKDQAIYCCYVNELNMVVAAFTDEGAGVVNAVTGSGLVMMHSKYGAVSSRKPKNTVCTMQTKSSNSLTVQPYSGLGQSMPNLNLNSIQNRATLRRGFAFSTSIKNPPLIKTRNVSSQQSFALSQQQSFNSASLAQHQQCLPSPSNTLHGAPNNSGTNSAIEGCAVASGLTLSSANVSFFKRKNSFQSVPNNSATSSVDQSLPNET
uniref:DH domain-containing protein n=1 Tax=Anopheles coluzzii TaxID=1518534 RepID=A0A8W7Q0X7_ANOCL